MDISHTINASLKYIEENLKTDIKPSELADIFGYSHWHYCRLFTEATGMPVMKYVCKRRLDKALEEISNGRTAIDVVMEYGYETYSGFYKAFLRMYGCSPKKYLSLYEEHRSERIGEKIMLTKQELYQILKNWNISQYASIGDVHFVDGETRSSSAWVVEGKYTLRTGPRDALIKDLRVEKALATQGFTAGSLLTTQGAEYLEGKQIFTLTHRPLGKPLSRSNRFGEQRLDFAYKYGTSIAKLHHALLSVEGDIMPNEINLYKTVVDWALPEVKKQNEQWKLELSEDFFTDYIVTFGSLFPKLPQQLIHRNPCPPFILFKDNEVNGFYGYDLSERNLRLFDPCYCATGILAEHEGVEDAFEKWIPILKEIIHGYDKVNPLTSEEKESIYYVVCSIQMIFIPWCEPQSQLKDLGKLNRKMLQLIIANKEIIKGQIKSL